MLSCGPKTLNISYNTQYQHVALLSEERRRPIHPIGVTEWLVGYAQSVPAASTTNCLPVELFESPPPPSAHIPTTGGIGLTRSEVTPI